MYNIKKRPGKKPDPSKQQKMQMTVRVNKKTYLSIKKEAQKRDLTMGDFLDSLISVYSVI